MSTRSSSGSGGGRRVGVHFEGDLRRALIDEAVAVIAEVGAEGLSLREVARRLGVSHAAPANHFGDKAGLLTAVATEGFERFNQHMAGAVLAAAGEPPVEVLLALATGYASFAEAFPGHFSVMFLPSMVRLDDPAYVAASDAAFDALLAVIEGCQAAGWRAGEPSRSLAAAAWSLAHGITALRQQGSLARHHPDVSSAGIEAMGRALIG